MVKTIILDSTELSKLVLSKAEDNRKALLWLEGLLSQDNEIMVPEVVDYEIRRLLIKREAMSKIKRLDALCNDLNFAPITREVMLYAAEFWAEVRKNGKPTADEKSLDADAIIAGHTKAIMNTRKWEVLLVTENIKHFKAFSAINVATSNAISLS